MIYEYYTSLGICQNFLLIKSCSQKQFLSPRTDKTNLLWRKSFSGCHSRGDWLYGRNISYFNLGRGYKSVYNCPTNTIECSRDVHLYHI